MNEESKETRCPFCGEEMLVDTVSESGRSWIAHCLNGHIFECAVGKDGTVVTIPML